MPTPDVDMATILDLFEQHEVSYVVIGGFAAKLHHVAVPLHETLTSHKTLPMTISKGWQGRYGN